MTSRSAAIGTFPEGSRAPHNHMHRLTVRGGRIVADTVFCGGRWPASLLAEMEAASA